MPDHHPLPLRRLMAAAILSCFGQAMACAPINGTVVSGTACATQNGSVLTIHTTNAAGTSGAIINWPTFNVPKDTTTHFQQPSAASSVLNRVLLNEPSTILGTLSSNGRVFLINPAGIMVGPSGRIDTAAFVASTLNITNADFLANQLRFGTDGLGGGAGSITNEGVIKTPEGGSIYLVAPDIRNAGIVTASGGEVILAAGHSVRLVNTATPGVSIEIKAAGDMPLSGLRPASIVNTGTVSATSVVADGGRVFLKADLGTGTLRNAGTLSTLGAEGRKGGFIETSAASVDLNEGSYQAGKGGTWLIDPHDITVVAGGGTGGQVNYGSPPGTDTVTGAIPGSTINASVIESSLNSGSNVVIDTAGAGGDAGDIVVSAGIQATAASVGNLTFRADHSVQINEDITSLNDSMNVKVIVNQFNQGGGSGTMTLASGKTIETNGGYFQMQGGGASINGTIATNGGAVKMDTMGDGSLQLNGSINAGGSGEIHLRSLASGIAINQSAGSVVTANHVYALTPNGATRLSETSNMFNKLTAKVNSAVNASEFASDSAAGLRIEAGSSFGESMVGLRDSGNAGTGLTAGNGGIEQAAGSQVDVIKLTGYAGNGDINLMTNGTGNKIGKLGTINASGRVLIRDDHGGLEVLDDVTSWSSSAGTKVFLRTADGTLRLAGNALVKAANGGINSIILATPNLFENNSTRGAIDLGAGGTWLIYAGNHAGANVLGGLSGNNRYNCTLDGCLPGSSALSGLSGNRFVWLSQPVMTLTMDSATIDRGESVPTLGITVSTGTVSANDTTTASLATGSGSYRQFTGDALEGTLSVTGLPAGTHSPGTYSLGASGLTSRLGYRIDIVPGTLTIRGVTLTDAERERLREFRSDREERFRDILPLGERMADARDRERRRFENEQQERRRRAEERRPGTCRA